MAKTVLVAAVTLVGAGMLTDQAPLANVADSWLKALLKVIVEGGRLTALPLETVTVPPSM